MTQQPKYYTPSIEEFYIGFEFEHEIGEEQKWVKKSFNPFEILNSISKNDILNLAEIELLIRDESIRVKYLDSEDIKELGWVSNGSGIKSFRYRYNDSFDLTFFIKEGRIIIGEASQVFFHGYCYNKRELKFLMKRLGIKSE